MSADLLVLRFGTRGARKTLDLQAKRLPAGLGQALDARAESHKEELERYTPEGETGKLKKGWRIRRSGAGGRARRTIYNTQGYLGLVLRGRSSIPKPGAPPRTKPLVFRVGGKTVFAMSVKGVAPNPFHRTAARAARRRADGAMHRVLVRTLRV